MATRSSQNGIDQSGALTAPVASDARRSAWSRPRIDVLPRLSELVLQTGGGIPGGGGSGGSTVF
jgi:hypothetical protein